MEEIPLRPDGLQIGEDRRFQERFWTAERFAWGAFGLVIVAAAAGLTGGGGRLSEGSRTIGEARIDYPAITRWATSDSLKVHLPQSGTPSVLLGPRFLEAFVIEGIQPQPASASTGAQGLRFEFNVDGEAAAPITIRAKALRVGRVEYDVSVEGAGTVGLSTLVLP